jgi:hypothetical protein
MMWHPTRKLAASPDGEAAFFKENLHRTALCGLRKLIWVPLQHMESVSWIDYADLCTRRNKASEAAPIPNSRREAGSGTG